MYGWQLKDFTSNLRHHKGKSFVVATYRYSLVLLLAFHALKIATNPGSGAIIKDLCSRVLCDCDALGTALTRGPPPRHKRIEDMARSTASSSTRGAAAASTTGSGSSRQSRQQGRGTASSGAIAAAAAPLQRHFHSHEPSATNATTATHESIATPAVRQ